MRKVILLAISALLFVACETETELAVPFSGPRLAVYSFFDPADTVWSVAVYETAAFSDSCCNAIEDASIILLEEGNEFEADFYYIGDGIYHADAVAKEGKEYTLRVEAPGFVSVKANSTVPTAMYYKKIALDSQFYRCDESICNQFYLVLESMGTVHYLRPGFRAKVYDGNSFYVDSLGMSRLDKERAVKVDSFQIPFRSVEGTFYPLALEIEFFVLNNNSLFISDSGFDTYEVSWLEQLAENRYSLTSRVNYTSLDLGWEYHFSVTTFSEDAFRYFHTTNRQIINTLNPLSNPLNAFSNIENGVGVFAASNTAEAVILYPEEGFDYERP